MKKLAILGSTGSIGRNALKIVEMFPDRFAVIALAAKNNTKLLARQIERFGPEIAVVFDERSARELQSRLPGAAGVEVMYGEDGYNTAAGHSSVEMVLTAVVGAAGLMPTLAAIEAGTRTTSTVPSAVALLPIEPRGTRKAGAVITRR